MDKGLLVEESHYWGARQQQIKPARPSHLMTSLGYHLNFYTYFFENHYDSLRKLGYGANQRNMNAALIRGFPVAFPNPAEQSEIVAALSTLDAKHQIHQCKHDTLNDLFRTLLQQLIAA